MTGWIDERSTTRRAAGMTGWIDERSTTQRAAGGMTGWIDERSTTRRAAGMTGWIDERSTTQTVSTSEASACQPQLTVTFQTARPVISHDTTVPL